MPSHEEVLIRDAAPTARTTVAPTLRPWTWLAGLDLGEREFLHRILSHQVRFPAGRELVAEDAPLDHPFILRAGWACRCVSLRDGRRQILDFYLPGDLVAYSSREGARALAVYVALTDVHISPAPALPMCGEKPEQFRRLLAALHSCEEAVEARLLAQIVRIGRHSATESLASLLLEIYDRCNANGELRDGKFEVPLTQEMMADALGLSVVHLNRTLQALKRRKLIAYEGIAMEIPALAELRALAERPLPQL